MREVHNDGAKERICNVTNTGISWKLFQHISLIVGEREFFWQVGVGQLSVVLLSVHSYTQQKHRTSLAQGRNFLFEIQSRIKNVDIL
jgi:hypothetical protein